MFPSQAICFCVFDNYDCWEKTYSNGNFFPWGKNKLMEDALVIAYFLAMWY